MNNNTTVYIGMDVHKATFTLCSMADYEETPGNSHPIPADYLLEVKYINRLKRRYVDYSVPSFYKTHKCTNEETIGDSNALFEN